LRDPELIVAIQRIQLSPDGKKVGRGMSLAPIGNAVIFCSSIWDAFYSSRACIAEGLETALTMRALGHECAMALCESGRFRRLDLPFQINAVTISGERDAASEKGWRQAGGRWAREGRDVDIWCRPKGLQGCKRRPTSTEGVMTIHDPGHIHVRFRASDYQNGAPDDVPPEEPADFARAFNERLHVEQPAQTSRKMRIEWFNTASGLALSEANNPLIAGTRDEGALSVIYGESNSGKTFVALDKATAVATGMPWNGKATKRDLVVYVAAEGGKRIMRRLAALKKRCHAEHGEDAPPPLLALVRFPIDLRSSDANLRELLTLIRDAEVETGVNCFWIVVDTLSRALAGGDENSPVDMGRIVLAADRIRAETGAHFSYVHHCGKDAARGPRGHSLLRAATDTEIEVTAGALKVTKQRDMERGEAYGFKLTDVYIGDDP
jgi:hypothetical protein